MSAAADNLAHDPREISVSRHEIQYFVAALRKGDQLRRLAGRVEFHLLRRAPGIGKRAGGRGIRVSMRRHREQEHRKQRCGKMLNGFTMAGRQLQGSKRTS
jgi:hypothetical protein